MTYAEEQTEQLESRPGSTTPEEACVVRFRAGDERAFDELVELTKHRIFAQAYRIIQDRDSAFDIVQEAYVKLLKFLPKWNYSCQVSTWLYRTVANACVDWHRRRAKAGVVEPELAHFLATHAQAQVQPAQASSEAEERAVVRAHVAQLPERMQACVKLRYFDGHSLKDVARLQNCSIGTVKATVFQAFKKLRTALRHD